MRMKPFIYSLAIALVVLLPIVLAEYPYPEPKPTSGLTPNTITRMSIPVGPSAYNNENPIAWDTDIGGGLQSRLNGTDRLAVRWARPGALVYDQSDRTYYGMDGSPLQATKPLFTLDGKWLRDVSLYTTNGQLTDHRLVDGNGKNLVFYNLDHFWPSGLVVRLRGTNAIILETPGILSTNAQVGYVYTLDNLNGTGEWHPATSGGATLYTGDGTISSNRMVTIGSNTLVFFNGTNDLTSTAFRVGAGFTRIGANTNLLIANKELWINAGTIGSQLRFSTPNTSAGTSQVGDTLQLTSVDYGTGVILADFQPRAAALNSGTATLAGGLYTVSSPTPAYTATTNYPDFFTVEMRVPGVNTGGESLKWGAGPSKIIKMSNNTALSLGELTSGANYLLSFSTVADAWILKNPAGTFIPDPAQNIIGMTNPPGSTVSLLTFNTNAIPSGSPSIAENRILGRSITNGTGAAQAIQTDPKWTVKNGVLTKDYDRLAYEIDDYAMSTSGTQGDVNWASSAGNGGATASLVGAAGHWGIMQLRTSTAANGFQSLSKRGTAIEFSTGNYLFYECVFRIPTLSISTESFKATAGYYDESAASDVNENNAIAATYQNMGAGLPEGDINFEVRAAGTGAFYDSGVPAVANTFYKVRIQGTTTNVSFTLFNGDTGAQLFTTNVTANIPTGVNRIGPGIKIIGLAGSTDRKIEYDRINSYGLYSTNP